ncbi:MAG: OmpA family protein [Desulfobulbaceae bacterium]|nr:OmpA family protein [Desulfobulbaceae bacterium]
MSAIRIVIAGILAILTTIAPQFAQAGNSIIVLPLADYSAMDSLTAARHQSQVTSDALTKAITAKGVTVTPSATVFTTLQQHKCITPLTYNNDLRPKSNTINVENNVSSTMSTRMQNEMKDVIQEEQKRMTPGLADPDNHLTKPDTTPLNARQFAIIGGELAGEYILRGRILAQTKHQKDDIKRHLPTPPLRRSILPIFGSVDQEDKYAVAAAESYDALDDIMLAGLFGHQKDNKQVVRMQLWVHDGRTGIPIWSDIKETHFRGKNPDRAIRKVAKSLINDFWAKIGIDSDGDGVYDHRDKCPNTLEGVAVTPSGCPKDEDKDTVPDYLDKCPFTPFGAKVDAHGCPLDTDKDGIDDFYDKCPDTPADAEVDENGCPKDSDGDGVPDYMDKCPNTEAGRKVDSNGCHKPVYEKVTMELNIGFDFDKTSIKPMYRNHLKAVADFMKKYPKTTAEIGGHTDMEGTAKYNQKLSQLRADAVRKYLIDEFKINPRRLTARGYGESQPLDKTTKRNPKNRRATAVFSATVEK